MKKWIALFLAVVMIAATFTACGKDEEKPTEPSKPVVEEPVEKPTESTPTETEPEETEPVVEYFSVLGLNPTGTVCTIEDIEFDESMSMLSDFTDISKINGSNYMYLHSCLPVDVATWDELKDVKVADIDKNTNYNKYTIAVMDGAFSAYNCLFDESASEMTIGEAYEAGLYSYIVLSESEDYYSSFTDRLLEGTDYEYMLEALVNVMGQPSYVYYSDFTNHITFDVVYELEDRYIVINGYEKMEDIENETNRICVQIVTAYGKNAESYKALSTVDETRFDLAVK